MNDNSGHSQNSIKIPRCFWQLDRPSAATTMATAPEMQTFAISFMSQLSKS